MRLPLVAVVAFALIAKCSADGHGGNRVSTLISVLCIPRVHAY